MESHRFGVNQLHAALSSGFDAKVATDPAPAPAGYAWSLDTGSPIAMKPCGYVVRLDVADRSIANSLPGEHNENNIEVGFCLRAK